MVTIQPAGTLNNGNLGVETQTIQVAELVSGDNPGTGADPQVTAPEGDIREVKIGATDQRASNIIISEQVDQQFQGATGNPQFTISLDNGILFHTQPVVSYTGGLVATIVTTTYPTSEITITVIQGEVDGVPGVIRISDVHLDLDTTVPVGDVMVDIAPVVAANNVQTLIGLDAASVDIANAVPDVVIDADGSVPANTELFLLKVKSAPATTVTGNLYVSVEFNNIPADAAGSDVLNGAVFYRPKVVPLPPVLPGGASLYIKLVSVIDPETGNDTLVVDNPGDFYYETGQLSATALPLRFKIGGGLPNEYIGTTLTVKTFYTRSGESIDQSVAIDSVTVLFN
jgi:hypothetical protein